MVLQQHAQYGYKVEVCVPQRGFAIGCTGHYGGENPVIDIFRGNISFHSEYMKKKGAEMEKEDDVELSENYLNDWIVLADKGYQGLARTNRVLTPIKNLQVRG